jgi:hypothetical protein
MPVPPTAPLDLARDLLGLTRRQVAAAAAEDWVLVAELIDERAPLAAALAALDPAPLSAATRAYLRAALTGALALDRQLGQQMRNAQTNVRGELTQVRRSRHTLRTYARPAGARESTVIDQPG